MIQSAECYSIHTEDATVITDETSVLRNIIRHLSSKMNHNESLCTRLEQQNTNLGESVISLILTVEFDMLKFQRFSMTGLLIRELEINTYVLGQKQSHLSK